MLRASEKRLRVGERLPDVFGGRGLDLYPNAKPPRLSGPTTPPVSGYVAWYDFSDLATLTHSGQRLTAVNDKSSGGFNLSLGAGDIWTSRLLTRPRRAVALFPGTGYFQNTSSGIVSDFTSSYFVVACVPNFSAFYNLIGPSGTGGVSFRVNQTTGALETDKSGNAVLGVQGNASAVALTPFVATSLVSATASTHYLNRTSETDAHAQTPTAGRTLRVGADSGGSIFKGWMGEVIIYDTTLSSGNAESVIDYLMAKWGIA